MEKITEAKPQKADFNLGSQDLDEDPCFGQNKICLIVKQCLHVMSSASEFPITFSGFLTWSFTIVSTYAINYFDPYLQGKKHCQFGSVPTLGT